MRNGSVICSCVIWSNLPSYLLLIFDNFVICFGTDSNLLRNETKIEILGEMEYHNYYDWYHIRDDHGREGWIQAQYVSDTNHISITPSILTKTLTSTNKPIPTKTPVPTRKPTPTPFKITWKCYDATSYDYNWSNDNRCVSSTGETRYVSDETARQLDPTYWPK